MHDTSNYHAVRLAILCSDRLNNELRQHLLLLEEKGARPLELEREARGLGLDDDACRAMLGELRDPRYRWLAEELATGRLHLREARDSDYPELLGVLRFPPPAIFLKGRLELLKGEAVALVGSRQAPEHALQWTEELARSLVRAGLLIVSGAALGVDGAAHRAAGAANTLAVLGCGFDAGYPAAHRKLLERIGREGLILSEWPPWKRAANWHFPRRNRIIAALARAVVVCAAGEKSGALNTARHALDEGRELFVCPGHPADRAFAGCLRLLRDGARPLRDTQDILDDLALLPWFGELVVNTVPAPLPQVPSDAAGKLLDLLGQAIRRQDLLELSGLAPGELAGLLLELELSGHVKGLPGDRWQSKVGTGISLEG